MRDVERETRAAPANGRIRRVTFVIRLGSLKGGAQVSSQNQLGRALREARRTGWTLARMDLPDVVHKVADVGATVVPTRPGEAPMKVLRPFDADSAAPSSLSAAYGRGCFPLHTDGAHLASPPDFVLLQAAHPTHVPTLLRIVEKGMTPRQRDDAGRGMFLLGRGSSARLTRCVTEDGRWRFDLGCMKPLDDASRSTSLHLTKGDDLICYEWADTTSVLILDNRQVLHGRPDVSGNPERTLLRLMLRFDHG